MSDFEQWWSGIYAIPSDEEAFARFVWQAALASMQGEAVGEIKGKALSGAPLVIIKNWDLPEGAKLFTYPPSAASKIAEQDARIKELEQQLSAARKQPQLTVKIRSFPESNGKRNWTAMLVRVGGFDGLIGNAGGITIDRGEMWNRVAYEAERTRFLLGERDTEPHILDYGDDIRTPEEWAGEVHGDKHIHDAAIRQIGGAE